MTKFSLPPKLHTYDEQIRETSVTDARIGECNKTPFGHACAEEIAHRWNVYEELVKDAAALVESIDMAQAEGSIFYQPMSPMHILLTNMRDSLAKAATRKE